MKALILAAGMGSRLMPLTNKKPKALVEVNGIPILMKQIYNLFENDVTEIYIVAGYMSEIIEETVSKSHPSVKIIKNHDYLTTNNMYSAYLGHNSVCDDAFIMMNGDVYFDASIITALICNPYTNLIVTDIGEYNEESMKVVENKGILTEISKQIQREKALGTSIDVYKFSHTAGAAFFSKCDEYINKKRQLTLWSEVAINDILQAIEFRACPVSGRWMEIDNIEDLEKAESIFSS